MTISDLQTPLRILIGDDASLDPEYSDDQIDGAVRTALVMLKIPELSVVEVPAAGTITPDPTRYQQAKLLLESARVRLGGEQFDVTLKTRGVYYSSGGKSGLTLLAKLRQDIYELEQDGDPDAAPGGSAGGGSLQDPLSFLIVAGGCV